MTLTGKEVFVGPDGKEPMSTANGRPTSPTSSILGRANRLSIQPQLHRRKRLKATENPDQPRNTWRAKVRREEGGSSGFGYSCFSAWLEWFVVKTLQILPSKVVVGQASSLAC
jgi:hypothetical protein